jgi:hypothetical protein
MPVCAWRLGFTFSWRNYCDTALLNLGESSLIETLTGGRNHTFIFPMKSSVLGLGVAELQFARLPVGLTTDKSGWREFSLH